MAKNPMEGLLDATLDEATVDLADTSHRDKGWWALGSANPNAWSGATEIMASSSADVLALQERRIEDGATDGAVNTARNLGWNMAV